MSKEITARQQDYAQWYNDLILKGLTNIKRFNPEEIAKQYINIYNRILTK